MHYLANFSAWIGKTFALWAILSGVLGFYFPDIFKPLTAYIVPVLGIIMFGMGLTLKAQDFVEIVRRPKQVIIGLLAQFICMPLIALLLSKVFALDPMLAIGVILVGCCPGGTASNVITFLARGDVALSVCITSFSTLLAPILTPLLLNLLAGELIDINLLSMMTMIAKIVVLPVLAGLIVHQILGKRVEPAIEVLPLISVSAIVIIVAAIVAASKGRIIESGMLIFVVVMLHNLIGLALGYALARGCGFNGAQRRAIMIEVGMQNSGLGTALATTYFSPIAALPSAIFSVWHNFSGALLANYYSKNTPTNTDNS